MTVQDFNTKTTLGRTGLQVSRLGIAAAYGVPQRAVERAVKEHGINYLHWDQKKPGMREALRNFTAPQRDSLVIAMQSYDHIGFLLRRGVEKGLKQLGIDRIDILFLGWFNRMPSQRVLRESQKLITEGKVGFLGVTGHNRQFHGEIASLEEGPFDVIQVRYNAAHRGAEQEVFSRLSPKPPGMTTYTATRWGKLLQPSKMPPGEKPLTAAECYRFVLSHPAVDVCLTGPRTEQEMLEGLRALTHGPLAEPEMMRIRKIGDYVHG